MIPKHSSELYSIELCAGGGGQALGIEKAGFQHLALVEIDKHACLTLSDNRPHWNVIELDLKYFNALKFRNKTDLVSGGVPCPPFSIAGKQLGTEDERNLFDEAIRIVTECRPKAVMLENVKGLLDSKFASYRRSVEARLRGIGYWCDWQLLNASDYGVAQHRPRVVLVAIKEEFEPYFMWPSPKKTSLTVGQVLLDLMRANGWSLADKWAKTANKIGPTLVGGSKKHGGPDLGPTGAKKAWRGLGVNGTNVMYDAPDKDFTGAGGYENMPYLSLRMTARLQGFPDSWRFVGTKTHAYRQIGNAFPPPVAEAVAINIRKAICGIQCQGFRSEQLSF